MYIMYIQCQKKEGYRSKNLQENVHMQCIYNIQASKVKQTNKAKQHSTPKAVTFPRKNELPQVGLEPTILYTLDRALATEAAQLAGPKSHIS